MCGFHADVTNIDLYLLVFLLCFQDPSMKGTMVVTCLKGPSPLTLYTPFSPQTAALHLSFGMAKMSLADKPMPVAHRVTSNN